MERKVQYLIIGAGLAGSTCAYLLQKAGMDVLVLERQDLSKKAKLCAGLVTPRSLRLLDEIFPALPQELFKTSFDSMLCDAAGIRVMLHKIRMKSVERKELDAFALQAYTDAGGRVLDRVKIRNYDFEGKVLSCSIDGAADFEVRYDTLIAADGALSSTRRACTGKAPDSIFSLEAIAPLQDAPLTMSYVDGFKGYSWYAPVGTRAKIGCCAYEDGVNLNERLDSFARELGLEYECKRGAFIPTGSDVLLKCGDVYFIGDAASLICPPSGEGIFYALLSAKRLSDALIEHISYETLMRRHVMRIRRQYLTRDLFFDTKFMTRGITLARSTPYGAERAVKFALRHFTGFH